MGLQPWPRTPLIVGVVVLTFVAVLWEAWLPMAIASLAVSIGILRYASMALAFQRPGWALMLGMLAVIYLGYTVSYLRLGLVESWTLAHHFEFVGWTGVVAITDALFILAGIERERDE